ncbi:MAG TPA: ectoine/hydroxyectoine ABC transporter permease subunit EhuC [Nocardioidaceae bacterium]|nr:ectoine/hydroxyectoine ABC transporter permease subunit EhuC [Nocardioidaceae bacterium]
MLSDVWDYLPNLLRGVIITLEITGGAAVVGLFTAFASGLMARSSLRIVRIVARVYVEVFRGTSAVVQLFWIFFVLPLLVGWQLFPIWAGILALGLNIGAYGSEVVRGSIRAVPRGQSEAAVALSFSPADRLRRIILPQAWVGMIPPFGNLLIELLKGSALVSLITVSELTFVGQGLRQLEGNTALIYSVVLIMYFILAYLITMGMRFLERRAKASLGMRPVASSKPSDKLIQDVPS